MVLRKVKGFTQVSATCVPANSILTPSRWTGAGRVSSLPVAAKSA